MKKTLVVSHERSGTHFLINSISMNFNLNARWIDIHCKDYIYPEEAYKKNYKKDIEAFFESQYGIQTDRIYKAHHQFGYYDTIIDDILEHFNIFYIYRDARDTLASCYKYFNEAPVTAFPKCDTIEEFLFETPPYLYPYDGAYSYIKSENMVERVAKHTESWKPVFDKITVLSYADLKNNFAGSMDKIADTLNVTRPLDAKMPEVGFNSIHPGQGITDGWKNVMSEEVSNKIKTIVGNVIS